MGRNGAAPLWDRGPASPLLLGLVFPRSGDCSFCISASLQHTSLSCRLPCPSLSGVRALVQVCAGLEKVIYLKKSLSRFFEILSLIFPSSIVSLSSLFFSLRNSQMQLLKQAFLWDAFEEENNEHCSVFSSVFKNLQTLHIV